ncbi:cupin domain-containing protein [Seonamhaeicola sediminis]|uniref:Cupin domain-containing protein n=1 Tax=Seonamhaeicola sediminis TaxID=2528206 RepID=A0A562YD79_9FLAO|nr:cupin domain-containing protein [Seonamhaeicola sediminis]TWO32288.1 cupin domain-containing protein [Seonamhaeicola sediminis]
MKSNNTKWVLGHKITPHESSGDFDLMVAETPAKVQGPPPHLHNSLKESFLIIEGEMEFFVNGEITILKAGESMDIPPNTLHTFSNKSDKPCKWINIHSLSSPEIWLQVKNLFKLLICIPYSVFYNLKIHVILFGCID